MGMPPIAYIPPHGNDSRVTRMNKLFKLGAEKNDGMELTEVSRIALTIINKS